MNQQTDFFHLKFCGFAYFSDLEWDNSGVSVDWGITSLGHGAEEKQLAFFYFFLLHEQYTNSPDLLSPNRGSSRRKALCEGSGTMELELALPLD